MKTWQILIFVTHVRDIFAVFAVSSGVYIDNGRNQTVMQGSISSSEKAQFEEGMLELLGLGDKPSRKTRKIDLSTSAPKFLLNLYNLMDRSDDNVYFDFDLMKTDYHIVEESDSIMTFLNESDLGRHLAHHKERLWFNVSSVPVGDTVISAELRLFGDLDRYDHGHQHDFTVTVFRVAKNLKGAKEHIFVDSKNVRNDFEGWLMFNVTSALISWIAVPSTNYGLYISVHVRGQSEPSDKILPEQVGIIMAKYDNDENFLPFIVAFFKSDDEPPRMRAPEVKSSVTPQKCSKRETNVPEVIDDDPSSYNNGESIWMQQSCQRRSMYVNFKEIGWHNWVVAPHVYEAYFCAGKCDFPLGSHMNGTNHAFLQSLLHLVHPSEVPESKCAPKELGPMSIIYSSGHNRMTLKRLENMVVKSCGCF